MGVRSVLVGDVAAFGLVVERNHASVLRVLTGILGDRHLAEDVAQEVWLLVYRKLDGFQFRSRFSTWLYRVAVREANSAKNRMRRFLARHSISTERVDRAHDEPAVDTSGREDVLRALAWLSVPERTAFTLFVEGLSYEEIARALGWPEGTVATRIKRAREKLTSVLEHEPMIERRDGGSPRTSGSRRGDATTATEIPR
ncbi:MAG: sigma-70 family RNA polymerase sigma factor [Planctomycetes bacterium]|nr:sigma-70 family RNA polymerase sigma factor [Planctomycetota bacterium]MCC7170532.1 sigma-70 family RNA polymerase sigma factor [Planctomycetota bacterium]